MLLIRSVSVCGVYTFEMHQMGNLNKATAMSKLVLKPIAKPFASIGVHGFMPTLNMLSKCFGLDSDHDQTNTMMGVRRQKYDHHHRPGRFPFLGSWVILLLLDLRPAAPWNGGNV